MSYKVLPYRAGSHSARALAEALRGRVLRLRGSSYRPRATDTIINWGNTDDAQLNRLSGGQTETYNFTGLREASNKLRFFQLLTSSGQGELAPRFWTNRNDIPADAFPIVCRTVLAGHSGEGIVIADTREQLVQAPLYVQYVKKEAEFRIHVGKVRNGIGRTQLPIISEQRKVRRNDVAEPYWRIRNHANGFIYQRHDIVVPDAVRDVARRALGATRLDFGAVDVIYNTRQARAYVLEINTAPGLEGQTVVDYANFFTN